MCEEGGRFRQGFLFPAQLAFQVTDRFGLLGHGSP